MITIGGKEYRNLVEQVQKNKDDIANYHNFNEALADWGIRIIGQLDVWSPPQGEFEYGDAYAVGPDGGPFVFYIWTRGTPDYWFDYGSISIVGPQGPKGDRGEPGADGKSSRWYVSATEPSGASVNDMWLKINSDGSTNGFVYIYQKTGWALATSIRGPQGPQGQEGKEGKQGIQGPAGPQGPRGYTTITNIIGELPEGSIISETYDPSSQPDNATVLMPVGGVQHAWVIINGLWTDAGPYSGGSTVYVGGQAVNSFNADTKLDIDTSTTTYNQVYVKNASGGQAAINVTKQVISEAIPQRLSSGAIQVPVVTQNPNEAASKQYVDNAIASVEGHGPGGIYYTADSNGGEFKPGIYYNAFTQMIINSGVIMPAEIIYDVMGSGMPVRATPWGDVQFILITGTWNQGSYKLKLFEAGATLGNFTCYMQFDESRGIFQVSSINKDAATNGAPPLSEFNARLTYPLTWLSVT